MAVVGYVCAGGDQSLSTRGDFLPNHKSDTKIFFFALIFKVFLVVLIFLQWELINFTTHEQASREINLFLNCFT